jgi:hypothetical protein
MSTATQSNWALQPPPPPAEQLRAYAQQLPDIYRDILVAFQTSGPPRTEGDPVAFGTIHMHLLNEGKTYTEAQLGAALDKLVANGFVSERDFLTWFAPTRWGEALIGLLTGTTTRPAIVPDLPQRTW